MYGNDRQRREEQIQELLRARPEATPRTADRSVIDFGLNVQRGFRADIIVVRVTLPDAFPSAAPAVAVVSPNVRHPWVDKAGTVVGCNALYTWSTYSRLTQVVSDVMNEFVRNPPQVVETPYPQSGQPNQAASSQRNSLSKPRSESEDGVVIPPVPHSFPELDSMSLEELRELQNDEAAFNTFFESMPMPTMTKEMHEQILRSNEEQARKNLGFKEEMEAMQSSLFALQEKALARWKAVRELEARQAAAMRKFDPLRLLTQLESSCNELDDESELIANEYLHGEIPLQDFLKRQLELRKLYHLRRAKAERFRAQLKQ